MKSRRWNFLRAAKILGLVIFGVIGVLAAVFLMPRESKKLPRMDIHLADTTLEELNGGAKTTKYSGNSLALWSQDQKALFEDVEIRGRGNSTWGVEKKPYQIKFTQKVDLFGMGKARKWNLMANYLDTSLLRNDLAFYLDRTLGSKYAMRGEFVRLSVDGEDLGLYYITPKVEIGKNRVDLKDELGILVEFENLHGFYKDCYTTMNGDCLVVEDLVSEDKKSEAMTDFVGSFNELEVAAREGDYEKVRSVADTESLAKYYLLSEFTVNPDAYVSSYFFYKDGVEDVIHAGPAWDFDYALGNRNWLWNRDKYLHSPFITRELERYARGGEVYDSRAGGMVTWEPDTKISKIIFDLMKIPEFITEVKQVYTEKMAGKSEETIEYITERAEYIRKDALYDNLMWGISDFDVEVAELKRWVADRFRYFESVYGENSVDNWADENARDENGRGESSYVIIKENK